MVTGSRGTFSPMALTRSGEQTVYAVSLDKERNLLHRTACVAYETRATV